MTNREKLINVFNTNALAYDQYRPRYPIALVESIIADSDLQPENQILEIGCGTGQITTDFVEKGYAVVAIDKGSALLDIAREKFQEFDNVRFLHVDFNHWKSNDQFKLVLAAQAFHWIPLEAGIQKVWNLLEPGGSLALIWHIDQSQQTTFWQQSSKIYDQYLPAKPGQQSTSEMVAHTATYLNAQTNWQFVRRKEFLWHKQYSKEAYLGLLSTFSGHMILSPKERTAFFKAMAALIDACGGVVDRYYNSVYLIAGKP